MPGCKTSQRVSVPRREFLRLCGVAAAGLPSAGVFLAGCASAASSQYDLLLAGGRVIDPAQGLSALRDVAITGGKIASIAESIPRSQAKNVFDAAGKLVVPGLIDLHGHVYDSGIPISIDPDVVGVQAGVTTIVDAGSAGSSTFPGFKKYVIERARTRIYALLNISNIGLVVTNELYLDMRMLDVKAAIAAIEQNRDLILGLKVRVNGVHAELKHDIEALKRAREVADATQVPIMLHWTNEPDLLAILKRGDILAHPFNPPDPRWSNLVGGEGAVILPQILELKERGIWTDFSHGGHLAWSIAENAAKQGWFPDVISTDIHRSHVAPNGNVIDLVTTMSKFLYLGLSLEQVIERSTTTPGKILKYPERIGTLENGQAADVTVLELEDRPIELRDSRRQVRTGRQALNHVATVRAGELLLRDRAKTGAV
jgi:dihydroorotase